MAICTLTETIQYPPGVAASDVRGWVRLVASTTGEAVGYALTGGGVTVGGQRLLTFSATGVPLNENGGALTLHPNSGVSSDVISSPTGTVYEYGVKFPGRAPTVRYLSVPDQASATVQACLATAPAALPTSLSGVTLTGTPSTTNVLTAATIGDTASRFRVQANGYVGWDPSASRANVPFQIVPVIAASTGIIVLVVDDAALTTYAGFQVQGYRGAKPAFVLTGLGGSQTNPTPVTQGGTLGEFAYQGQADSTVGHTWTNVALTSFAVENLAWTTNHGGMLVIQPIPRNTGMARIDGVKVWDGGQVELDPGNVVSLGGNWTIPAGRLRVVSQTTTERTAVLKAAASQTVPVLSIQNSAGTEVLTVSSAGAVAPAAATSATGTALTVAAGATDGVGPSNGGTLALAGGAAGAVTGANGGPVTITGGAAAGFATGGSVTIRGGSGTAGGNVVIGDTNTTAVSLGGPSGTAVNIGNGASAKVGFYGTAAASKPTVTGSKAANAALASLMTALATLGLVTDSTT